MSNLSDVLGGFNAAEVETNDNDYGPLPEGTYYVQLEGGELKQTKSGTGTGFNATFEVLGNDKQEYGGRKVFVWFNLQHQNEVAQKIGQAEFASLCKAVGVMSPQDTDELVGKPFVAKIGVDKKDATRNVIKAYKPMSGAASTPAAQPAAQTPAQAPAVSAPATPAPETSTEGSLPWA